MPQRTKDGATVFWRDYGTGPERAVLLHCALAHSGAWSRLATCLSDRLTMVAPDMPGHGRSDVQIGGVPISDQVTSVARNFVDSGTHLIGHSFGAVIALRLALEAPQNVRSLTLIEPVLFAAVRDHDPAAFDAYLKLANEVGYSLHRGDNTNAAKHFTSIWGDAPWVSLSETEQQVCASQMTFIRATERMLLDDSHGLLDAGGLETLSCPTLLIRGAETPSILKPIHKCLLTRIPNAREAVVAGARHMVPITHPKPVASHIEALLSAV